MIFIFTGYLFLVSLVSHKSLSILEFTVSKFWFRHALEKVKSVTSKQVTRIKFWYWLDKEETSPEDLWKELDDILSTDLFKSLLEVRVVCVCRNGESGWRFSDRYDRARIPSLLHNIHKKGIPVTMLVRE